MKLLCRRCIIDVVYLVVLILFLVQFVPLCFAVSFEEATEAIRRADYDLGSAFVAVAEAEGAGADVSLLLDKLDAAAVFLSEANSAVRFGNYESAVSSAVACSNAVEGVVDNAARLKVSTEIAQSASFFLMLTASGITVGVVLVGAFFVWRFLKRRYFRGVLDMKPEVEASQ